jgi:hypothetical protein
MNQLARHMRPRCRTAKSSVIQIRSRILPSMNWMAPISRGPGGYTLRDRDTAAILHSAFRDV